MVDSVLHTVASAATQLQDLRILTAETSVEDLSARAETPGHFGVQALVRQPIALQL